jgi:hypothetical protein
MFDKWFDVFFTRMLDRWDRERTAEYDPIMRKILETPIVDCGTHEWVRMMMEREKNNLPKPEPCNLVTFPAGFLTKK